MTMDEALLARGGVHWSWDATKPTYFGVFRRGGDGGDVQWLQGPTRSATHVMGAWDDNGRVYVDMEMSESNPFPFMPMKDSSAWDPIKGTSYITRLSADLSGAAARGYEMERLGPWPGGLPRQDDRYNTQAYRYGFLATRDVNASNPITANPGYVRFDHSTGKQTFWDAGPGTRLAECCFAPKSADAAEGAGYLMGVITRLDQAQRGDLVILDAEHLEDGPVATVKLPVPAVGQVHGWWVPQAQLP
jgi:carotenoid cleavage dioxygenase-like enzyme